MRKIIILLVVVLSTMSLGAQINPNTKPSPTEAKPIKIGEFHSFVADNNMKVFLIRKAGYPKFRVSIDFGIPLIPEEKQPEIRKVLEDVFAKGNQLFSSKEISEKADLYAATVSGFVRGVSCSGMKKQLDILMPMMCAYITAPGINEVSIKESVEKGLKKIAESAKINKKTPSSSFMARLDDSLTFYKNITPAKIEETAEGFSDVSIASVNNYFNSYINPNNSYCIISGDFTIDQAKQLINNYLSGWKVGKKISSEYTSSYSQNFPSSCKIYVVDKPEAVQSRISVKWPLGDAFPYGENEPLLMVLNQIYGEGYMSNLNQNIRLDKGLSYGAKNFLSNNITGGNCTSSTLVRNSETAYALENIFFEMLRMRNELVSPQTLDMAKNGLIGDNARSVSQLNSPAIIGFGMVKDKYNLPDDYLATYPLKISAITAEDIRKAAQKYIKPYECLVFIEGKVLDLKGKLEKFAPVEYYTTEGKRIY